MFFVIVKVILGSVIRLCSADSTRCDLWRYAMLYTTKFLTRDVSILCSQVKTDVTSAVDVPLT